MSKYLNALSLVVVALAWPTHVLAQSPDSSTFVFQDWVMSCSAEKAAAEEPADTKKNAPAAKDAKKAAPAAPKSRCEISQTFKNNSNGQVVAVVALGKPEAISDWKFVVQLPIGVWLPNGVQISTEGKPEIAGQFLRCSPQFCIAQADAKKELIDALKSGAAAELQFSMVPANKLKLKISDKGFSDAYSALEKRGQ